MEKLRQRKRKAPTSNRIKKFLRPPDKYFYINVKGFNFEPHLPGGRKNMNGKAGDILDQSSSKNYS